MIKLWQQDISALREEGWEVGAYWSDFSSGQSGWFIRHEEEHPDWVQVRTTPCSEDSIQQDELSVTAALLAALEENDR